MKAEQHIVPHSLVRIVKASVHQQRAEAILSQLPWIEVNTPTRLQVSDVFYLHGLITETDAKQIASQLLHDPVTESIAVEMQAATNANNSQHCIEVGLKPGVTDTIANELSNAIRRMGIDGIVHVSTVTRYVFDGELDQTSLERIAKRLLANATIHQWVIGELPVQEPSDSANVPAMEWIDLRGLTTESLQAINQERRLSLDEAELLVIQNHFEKLDRPASDTELEMIAQTWSEHCVHKTFKAAITIKQSPERAAYLITQDRTDPLEINSLIKTYLQTATQTIAAPWVLSAFVDNAGIIDFDGEYELSFKVETHNHPSAIEPFGGANTGVGGVVRDVLGVSHRPIANTDVLCFGPQDIPINTLPEGVLHPRRIQAGVVAGVEDYGNKLGIPTVNGAVLYHEGFTTNPLVYCGCVGIAPKGVHRNQPQPGDRVIVIGGRTGRDGLRGATFSSLTMDGSVGEIAGSSVQIGDPIVEKGLLEVVERASVAGLYNAITDCGAGGLSSAIGEMAAELGAMIDLANAPLKYPGLAPWEIWLSEAQERMVLAIAPEKTEQFAALCAQYWVEWCDLGSFTDDGRLRVMHGPQTLAVDLDMHFLHEGRPQRQMIARVDAPSHQQTEQGSCGSPVEILLSLLAHPNIRSKEAIVRKYDHLVRGGSVVSPFAGPGMNGPSDAAVIKPRQAKGQKGFVLSNGINPWYSEIDPYWMAWAVVDEAIRNAVCSGADPNQIAILDNFCWGDPRKPDVLGSLVEAVRGCHDASVHYRTPFISGKDSLNNEYIGPSGERMAIPGTLLISAIGIVPDIQNTITMDLKQSGSVLMLVGDWTPILSGSHSAMVSKQGSFGDADAWKNMPKPSARTPEIYAALHSAIQRGLILSAHDLSEGGLAVCASEMCLAGDLGAVLEIGTLHADSNVASFAESCGCLLVECAAEHVEELNSLINSVSGGGAIRQIGWTTDQRDLVLRHMESVVLQINLTKLNDAFHGIEAAQ